MRTRTLLKIKDDIYALQNERLIDALTEFNYGIKKTINCEIVKKEVMKMIEELKNTKVKFLGMLDMHAGGKERYMITAGFYKCDFIGKNEACSAYKNLIKRAEKLEKFIKKYCKAGK